MQLPIFPLNLVVLPGEPVPLHIFEQRYQKLITDTSPRYSGDDYKPFGIQYSRKNQMNEVGCTVVVKDILHRYPEGRLDLLAYGEQRYRLLSTDHPAEGDYLTGQIEWLHDDDPEEEVSEALSKDVLTYYRRFLSIVDKEDVSLELPVQDRCLSFTLAYRINLEVAPRLELLDTHSEVERLELLLTYFEHAIPKLQKTREFRRRVRSNGYFA